MSRFNRRFEVKREMSDSGKIRPDDNESNNQKNIDPELLEELEKVGFDDEEFVPQQEDIEIRTDENGDPVIPEGWTFLTHGSSLDRWDTYLLGTDFIVGKGKVNGQEVKGRPLCCVERSDAKFNYERRGSTTAKAYGGKQQAFEIRVLFYKNPRLGDGKIVRDKLNQDEIKNVSKYYMYQDGRHPAVPIGTKLVFVKSGDFDEITNTNGNNILWYIPEEYLQQYLEDVQHSQEIDSGETSIDRETEMEQANDENVATMITNADVEQELTEFYTDDITIPEIEAYLSEKISQIYGDRLGDAGIFNIRKFLDGKLDYFEGVESYRAIIEELESALEFAESLHESGQQGIEHSETESEEPVQEEVEDEILEQDEKVDKVGQSERVSFDQVLSSAGFSQETIAGLKSSIQTVSPSVLLKMDSILERTNEQTLARGGNKDGHEQDAR